MRTAVLTLAAFFSVGPAFGQMPTAEEVLKKAIEVHGGADVLNKYPAGTSKMKGVITIGDKVPFTGSLAFAVPGKVHTTIEADFNGVKVSVDQIINGDKVVQLENGKKTPLSETMRNELHNSPALQEMSLLTPLLDAKKYTLSLGREADVNGQPAYAVVVKAAGRKDVTLFFDKKTGLLSKTSRKALNPQEIEVTEDSTFSDFQKIAGMIVPLKFEVKHDGRPFMSVTVSDYTPLEKIDEKEFAVE